MWSARGNTALVGIPWKTLIWDPNRVTHMGTSLILYKKKNHWLKGLAPDAPPRLDAGVLEDSTGFAWLRNSLEN